MTGEAEDSVQAAIRGELRLLEPQVRASAERLEQLLSADFAEIGASGRRWDRASMIAVLTRAPPGSQPSVVVSGMVGVLLAPGLVHLTFTTESDGRRVHRSSLWRLAESGWRIYFHQGTPAAALA